MGILIVKHFSDYRDEHAYYGKRDGKKWGAIAGAGAGAAIGRKLGGKSTTGQAIGALAGGAIGGVGGFIAGSKIGKKIGRKLGRGSEKKRFEVTYTDLQTGMDRHKRFDFIQEAQIFHRQHPGSHISDLHHQQPQQPNYSDEDWS